MLQQVILVLLRTMEIKENTMIKDWFGEAFEFTIGAEGGYVDNKNDPGGETNFGISKRSYPKEDIKGMTVERARELYYKDYWCPAYCEELVDINKPLTAMVIFDTSVHSGNANTRMLLQMAVGVKVDAMIGKYTKAAIELHKDMDLVEKVLEQRQKYYKMIISKNKKLKVFENGWANRLSLLKKKVNEISKNM